MAHEWGQEIWRHEDQVDVWRKMAGWLIDCPMAFTGITSEPHPAYPGNEVIDSTWVFYTPEPNSQGVRHRYTVVGQLTGSPDKGVSGDLYAAKQVLSHPDMSTERPRKIMPRTLLGISRPGVLRNRKLPTGTLCNAVAVTVPSEMDTIKLRIDSQHGTFCAGEAEEILGINDPTKHPNYFYALDLPHWFGVLNDLVVMSAEGHLAPGEPRDWHTKHKPYGE